jgi:A/G-specific adenine glycosylase
MTGNSRAAKRRNHDLAEKLLAWYARHARALPWRAPPGVTPDPYAVWLSEIMLQQTTVAAVKDYYRAFLARWPSVEALAAAPLDDVLRAWAGLGYYARARNLHACAKAVAAAGGFPRGVAGLRELPGIGPYTAGAIAAIAFGERAAAVDGNAERVLSRLDAVETPLPEAKPALLSRAEELVPADAPGDFVQALMDLGSGVCTPRKPPCLICPWTDDCQARMLGIAETLPRKAPKRAQLLRRGIAFWAEREDGAVLLRRRPEKGLLGGMMEIPSTAWTAGPPRDPSAEAPFPADWRDTGKAITHTFTHFHLELSIWQTHAPQGVPGQWVPRHLLLAEALPTAMRKIVERMGRG